MTTITRERREIELKPGFHGFDELAEAVGLDLEPFQRRIVKAALGPEREELHLGATRKTRKREPGEARRSQPSAASASGARLLDRGA